MSEEFTEEFKESSSTNYKCPECGAPLEYDPSTLSLKCSYCLKIIKLSNEECYDELDFDKIDEETLNWKETYVIKCENCGADIVSENKDLSVVCPFCSSTQVIKTEAIAGMKPNRIIPFRLTNTDAIEAYKKYINHKLLVPKKVKKMSIDAKVNGVYLSSWTYDSNTFSIYKGRLGKHYTVTVGSGKNRRTVTKTRYFNISGTNSLFFDDLLINAGSRINQGELNKLLPFNTGTSTSYKQDFLAGFTAEHYERNVKECFKDAKKIMQTNIRANILKQYHYDVVDYLNISTSYNDVKYKYVLLPIWIGNFSYSKKNYRFLVNGETGKTSGKYPISGIKVALVVVIIIAIVMFFVILAMNHQVSYEY